jgi:molybdopterin/thiamine biosynthesis adenylyltransferase
LTKSASKGSNGYSTRKVLIVGAGGLGSPAALYLAAAGVGRITLADGDTVDLTNLQRQILHTQERIGQAKALSGQTALARRQSRSGASKRSTSRLAGEALAALVADADVVLDCCDNFATRHAVNRACVRHRNAAGFRRGDPLCRPIAVFDSRRPHTPATTACFPKAKMSTKCAVR